MVYISLDTVAIGKRHQVVVRISVGLERDGYLEEKEYLIRPTVHIKKAALDHLRINKKELLHAAPFCDHANELIETIGAQSVRLLSNFQYRLFVSEFKTIGYNCALKFQTLDYLLKQLSLPSADAEIHDVAQKFLPDDSRDSENASSVSQLYRCFQIKDESTAIYLPAALVQKDRLLQLSITGPLLRKPGVYYFKNAEGKVIYVGKAKRVRERLQSHFNNASGNLMYDQVAAIDLQYTGSDLIAQLLESHEIKRIRPKFNTQQVKTPKPYQILTKTSTKGITRFVLEQKNYTDDTSEVYFNRNSARQRLRELCAAHNLCPKFCSLERVSGPCSAHKAGSCCGVCAGDEEIKEYNQRVTQALQALLSTKINRIIQLPGRIKGEHGFVLVTNAIYQGFGFYNDNDTIANMNDLEAYVKRYSNNYDTARIIATVLKKIPKEQILNLEDAAVI